MQKNKKVKIENDVRLSNKDEYQGIVVGEKKVIIMRVTNKRWNFNLQKDTHQWGVLSEIEFNDIWGIKNEKGEIPIVECVTKKGKTLYSINGCQEICKVKPTEKIIYKEVAGEIFIKITNSEGCRWIDDRGNLIADDLGDEIVFSGTGAAIKAMDGSLRTLDGHVISW